MLVELVVIASGNSANPRVKLLTCAARTTKDGSRKEHRTKLRDLLLRGGKPDIGHLRGACYATISSVVGRTSNLSIFAVYRASRWQMGSLERSKWTLVFVFGDFKLRAQRLLDDGCFCWTLLVLWLEDL
jgi:hypothetical protein